MTLFSAAGRLSLSLFAAALIVGLVSPASAQRKPSKPRHPVPMPREREQPQPAEEADLKPIFNGPGIQICEPVASGSSESLADFGGGCALWLQWAMGFHPELGQTPRWELGNRARKELHVPRLRLSLAQGSRLYNILGVTHVAVGQITGTETKCLLTYQLYAVPTQKAIGTPIKLTGTEEQVIAQLPQAAGTLLKGLGVKTLHVPVSVGATPAELTAVGHYGWYEDQKPTEAEQKQIEALSQKLPLASLLSFVHYRGPGVKDVDAAAQHLLDQASGNFLMLGVLATYNRYPSPEFARAMDSKVAAVGAPDNAVLAYWAINRARTPAEVVQAAKRLVQLSPHTPTSWNTLAHDYGDQQESIRLARIFAGLAGQEAETLIRLYARWKYAAVRATTLDPDYQSAWRELAVAATFEGDFERADAAFWKARELDKNDLSVYTWGLEMYQTKWGGNPETLAKVARLAITTDFPPDADLYALGSELRSAGFAADAKAMYARAIVQARQAVRQSPNLARTHLTLGYYLSDQQQYQEAEKELKTAIDLDPDSHAAHFDLGRLYRFNNRLNEAVVQLREDVRITSGSNARGTVNLDAKTALAEVLLMTAVDSHYEEPERLLNEVLKVEPNWYLANEDLGWLMVRRKQYDTALTLYGIAARLKPDYSVPYREMGRIYRLQSKFEEAVRQGEAAVSLAPKSYDALVALAETYTAKGDYDLSVKTYRQVIAFYPAYAPGHFYLGKVYLQMEKKDEARAELKRALELNPTPDLQKSIQDLLNKNP